MRWLDGTANPTDTSLSELWELAKDRKPGVLWPTGPPGVGHDRATERPPRAAAAKKAERRAAYPQDLPGDVGYPVFLQRVALGVLHEVCDGSGPTELHNELEGDKTRTHPAGGQSIADGSTLPGQAGGQSNSRPFPKGLGA